MSSDSGSRPTVVLRSLSTLLDIVRTGRPSGEPNWTLHDLYQVLRGRLLDAGLPAPNIRYTDTAGLFRLARNAAFALSDDRVVAAADSTSASGSNFALMVWRKADYVQRDWTGRQYGETGEDENIQLDADRMWWRIAHWRIPHLKALVFITGGRINRIREVYGIDKETTGDGSYIALHVSPPLNANEVAERLPALPLTLGSEEPAVQGKLREYLVF